jgi:hypothetical protein
MKWLYNPGFFTINHFGWLSWFLRADLVVLIYILEKPLSNPGYSEEFLRPLQAFPGAGHEYVIRNPLAVLHNLCSFYGAIR